jgi:hypothetical protein
MLSRAIPVCPSVIRYRRFKTEGEAKGGDIDKIETKTVVPLRKGKARTITKEGKHVEAYIFLFVGNGTDRNGGRPGGIRRGAGGKTGPYRPKLGQRHPGV